MASQTKYNKKLALIVIALTALITFRLLEAAIQQNNWPGFYWSLLHVVIVAGGSYLALRRSQIE
jgi:hypothetical protein